MKVLSISILLILANLHLVVGAMTDYRETKDSVSAVAKGQKVVIVPEDRILFLGNSITQGASAEILFLKENFQQPYQAKNKAFEFPEFLISGISGEQTAEGLKRVDPVLNEFKPSICIVNYGTCEVTFKNIHLFKTNMQTLIDKLKSRGIKVVLVTPPPCSAENWSQAVEWPIEQFQEGLPQIRQIVFELGKENKLQVVDSYTSLLNFQLKNKVDLTTDGIHLTKEGYRIMADDLLKIFTIRLDK